MDSRDKNLLLLSVFRCYDTNNPGTKADKRTKILDFKETAEALKIYELGEQTTVNFLLGAPFTGKTWEKAAQSAFEKAAVNLERFIPNDLKKLYDQPVALEDAVKTRYEAAYSLYQEWTKSPAQHFESELTDANVQSFPGWLKKQVRIAQQKLKGEPAGPPVELNLAVVKQTLISTLPTTLSKRQREAAVEKVIKELERRTGKKLDGQAP